MKNFKFFVCSVLVLWALLGSCKNGSDSDGENPDFPENLAEYVGNESYKSPKNVEISAEVAKNQSDGLKGDWWRETSFYHIWVKSFADSNNDGCGDFKGKASSITFMTIWAVLESGFRRFLSAIINQKIKMKICTATM